MSEQPTLRPTPTFSILSTTGPPTTVPTPPSWITDPTAQTPIPQTPILLPPPYITDPNGMTTLLFASTTVANGVFGVGAQLDPLIIFALVVAGLTFFLLLGLFIYCCCAYCGVPTRQEQNSMRRTGSLRSYRQEPQPLYLRASVTPQWSSSAAQPAASVFLEQPVRLNVGAYSVGDGTYGRYSGLGSTRVRQVIEPEVVVTRRPVENQPVLVHTITRKKYLYPTDLIGGGNDVTYNSVRPNVITTLGDGYATGHSIRSTGKRNGGRSFLVYD